MESPSDTAEALAPRSQLSRAAPTHAAHVAPGASFTSASPKSWMVGGTVLGTDAPEDEVLAAADEVALAGAAGGRPQILLVEHERSVLSSGS